MDNTYEAFTPQGNEIGNEIKFKESNYFLSIYFGLLFVFASVFTLHVGLSVILNVGKYYLNVAVGILVILSIISSEIACHSLWDSVIAVQNGDISEQEERS